MSHSGNVTVENKNTTIYVNSLNAQMKALGLSPVPTGDPVPKLTQTALGQMRAKLLENFGTTFDGVDLPASNHDGGYVGPLSANKAGQAPACVVDQIQADFDSWGLPKNVFPKGEGPEEMAKQISDHISSKGGQPGFFSGTRQITSSEDLFWMVGWLTVNITQDELGILYVFAATVGIQIIT